MYKLFRIKTIMVLLCILTICISSFPLTVFANEVGNANSQIIVSLGDSYSSGEGIEPFYGQDETKAQRVNNDDWLAHRSKNSWSGMLTLPSVTGTMAENRDTHWFFAAVSGAVTNNLSNVQNKEYKKGKYSGNCNLPAQLEIFETLGDKKADYVTLTLGGNDADFAGVITDVIMGSTYLNLSGLSDKINDTWEKFYEDGGIKDCLQESYEKISQKAGAQAHIIVAGYPKLLDSSGKGFFVSKEEATIVNVAVSNFNNAIEHIVTTCSSNGLNISFVSVESAFEGHGAYSDDPYINEVIFGPKLQDQDLKDYGVSSAYSVHPNYKGAKAYAQCVQTKIDELEGTTPIKCSTELTISTLGYYGQIYDNYTIVIDGRENVALWGLIGKDYYREITVNEAIPVSVTLPEGSYKISVADEKMSYFKNIKVGSDYENDLIIFNTNFGYVEAEKDIYENHAQLNIPSDAVEFNGHWYKVLQDDTITDWNAALQYCNAQNGYLATITSQEENDFLYSYIKQEGYESAYFGLSDAASEGTWAWANGEAVTYTNWHKNEPNGENSGEDYALFYYKYSDGTWNDGDFGNRTVNSGTAFICEWGEYTVRESEKQDEPIRTTSDERDIVLVLDVSGSMSGTPMEETKKASVNFIDTILDEDASIGIVTYDNSASMLSDFSVNKSTLTNAVSDIWDGGGTNIEAGLAEAHSMLSKSNAKKKIIVLMSDGEPNDGKEGDDLIAYADELKDDGIIIYTLGFFENMGGYKSSAQLLMEGIASDGCHYEVASADDLVFFFEDVADQINGQKYIYIRIACPVDVTVTYKGETLCSAEDDLNVRTDFGTLTFEDNENISGEKQDDRIKVLRLKEGADYDVQIVGTGHGIMDYTIGFMDENGDYSDFRRFENIKITRRTTIDTVAAVSKESVLNIDEDGDGKYDLKLRAEENGYGEEVEESIVVYVVISGVALLLLSILLFAVQRNKKIKKTKEKN